MRSGGAQTLIAGLIVSLSGYALAHQAAKEPATGTPFTCALDSEYYKRNARALAAQMPGGALEDPNGYAIGFDNPAYGRVSLRIGGCAHLGLVVSAKRTAPAAPSRGTAMAIARRLTIDYLVPSWNKDLLDVLSQPPSRVVENDGRVVLVFERDNYLEFAVTYSFENGQQTIEVFVIPDT